MKTYLVQILAESTLRLPDTTEHALITDNDGRWKITLENYTEDWPELEVKKYFLRCWVELTADTLEEARESASSYLEELLDTFSFALSHSMGIFRVVSVTDWSKGLKARTHRSFWPSPFLGKVRAEVERDFFEKSIQLLDEKKIPSTIPRALRCFRKGLLDTDPIDKFVNFFIVIEIVSDNLKPKGKVKRNCPTCGKAGNFAVSGNEAIKELLVNRLGGDADYAERVCRIRNACLHSGDLPGILKKLEMSQADFLENVERLKQTSIDAICLAVGWDTKELPLKSKTLGSIDFEQVCQFDYEPRDPSDEPKRSGIPEFSLEEITGPTEAPKSKKVNPNLIKKLFFG